MAFKYTKNSDGTDNRYKVSDAVSGVTATYDANRSQITFTFKDEPTFVAKFRHVGDGTSCLLVDKSHSKHEAILSAATVALSGTSPRIDYLSDLSHASSLMAPPPARGSSSRGR